MLHPKEEIFESGAMCDFLASCLDDKAKMNFCYSWGARVLEKGKVFD